MSRVFLFADVPDDLSEETAAMLREVLTAIEQRSAVEGDGDVLIFDDDSAGVMILNAVVIADDRGLLPTVKRSA